MLEQNKKAVDSAKNLIYAKDASCVVIKDNIIVNIDLADGISPIIKMYESGILEDTIVVDKIVGKAAAAIMSLGRVKACYGIVVSEAAVEYLRSRRIEIKYDTCVKAIINRRGDGQCPMEDAVKDIDDEVEAMTAIKQRLAKLKISS